MRPKKVNKTVGIVGAALSAALPTNDSPEIPVVASTLLATFQQGMAVGLTSGDGDPVILDDPIWRAGHSAGERLAQAAAQNPKSESNLWRDMARHGLTSGRFGSSQECRPTLNVDDIETDAWLAALWDAAFAIGAKARAEVGAQLEPPQQPEQPQSTP